MSLAVRSKPADPGQADPDRLQAYRLLIYLAVTILVAGSFRTAASARMLTSGVYLGLGLAGVVLQRVLEGRRFRRLFWPFVLVLDVTAQGFVLARMEIGRAHV
jgi:hypothetical protein